MITPGSYYGEDLEGKSKEEIMTVIRRLRRRICGLKRIMEASYYESRPCPSEYSQLSVARLYLDEAKRALIEAGGEYIPSASEKRDIRFNESIPYIRSIELSVSGFLKGRFEEITHTVGKESVTVKREGTKIYELSEIEETAFEMKREDFLSALSELHIGEWRKHYDSSRFGYEVVDGTNWQLCIRYGNGRRSIKIEGSNDYPYNFGELLSLLGTEM